TSPIVIYTLSLHDALPIYIICIFLTSFFSVHFSLAQSAFSSSSSDIQLQMERLSVLGSVLYFAAHPDDENTKLISYLASERKVRSEEHTSELQSRENLVCR